MPIWTVKEGAPPLSRRFLGGQFFYTSVEVEEIRHTALNGRSTSLPPRKNNVDTVNETMYKKYVPWAPCNFQLE